MTVPALRFPEFAGELKATNLGDVMAINSAARVLKDEWKEEGVPFFRSSDVVSNYKGTVNKKAFISEGLFNKLSKQSGRLVKNDLLVTGGGSIGVPYLVTSDEPLYSKDADLIWLKNKQQTHGPFIYAFLISPVFRKYLKSISHIGTISHYTIEQAKATPLRLPSLPEQKKIAAFLGVVDAKIAALRARRAGLERYKRGLMQALFSQTLRFTKPDGSPFPDWEEKRLGEVFSERSERGNKGAELLSVTLSRGVLRAVDVDRANGASADRSNYKTVHVGDIAYNSMRMWQGANGVSEYFGIVSPAYTVIIPKEEQLSSFWGYYFKLTRVVKEFQRHSQGLTSDTWNLKFPALSSIKLPIPHPDEQAKIADALSAMDAKIAAVGDQVAKMEAFKKGLLQQMFV